MARPTKRSKAQDQRRLALAELEAPLVFKHKKQVLAFAVNVSFELFKASVISLLGSKFWNRLQAEAKRNKTLPLGYAHELINK